MQRNNRPIPWQGRLHHALARRITLRSLFRWYLLFVAFICLPAFFIVYVTNDDDDALVVQTEYKAKGPRLIQRPQYNGPASLILRKQYDHGSFNAEHSYAVGSNSISKRSTSDVVVKETSENQRDVLIGIVTPVITITESSGASGEGSTDNGGSSGESSGGESSGDETDEGNSGDESGSGEGSGSGEETTTGPTTTTKGPDPATKAPPATTLPTTVGVSTTAATGQDAGVPVWVVAVASVGGFILGVLVALGVVYCLKKRKEKLVITPFTSPYSSHEKLREIEEGKELDDKTAAVISREDMINRALLMGSPVVLEFAINEARSSNLQKDNKDLINNAENKLYQWKRILSGLNVALQFNDPASMTEYMKRFKKQNMKDDTKAYKRCEEFLDSLGKTHEDMDIGIQQRDEILLGGAIAQYGTLNVPKDQVETDKLYKEAVRVKEEIRQEKLRQGRTQEEFRQSLRMAIASRDPVAITAAVTAFKDAEIPDTNNDLDSAKNALEEIEQERKANQSMAFAAMVTACETRDQIKLKESLDECRKWGVPQQDIENGEKLLPTIIKEDELLAELNVLTQEEDMQKLNDALVVYKTPALMLTDKTGDVARAEKVLERLQERDRMRRTKGDVMWRLQAAMAVGDVTAMDGMIKALQGLAASGEDIPEAFLIRAMAELENCRGQVNYRKRMEAIKSAIARAIAAEDIAQLEDLVDQMTILADDIEYTVTSDDTRVLDSSREELNTLKNKFAIRQEIDQVKPELLLPLIPGNVPKLREAVTRMSEAKDASKPYEGLFTEEEDVMLQDSIANVDSLEEKVKISESARYKLNDAVDKREFVGLRSAIKQAHAAPFIERNELYEPIQLAKYLDPRVRILAVKTAMRARDIMSLEQSLADMKDAGVEDDAIEAKASYMLEKLRRRKIRQQKLERKKEREDAKRKEDIARLTGELTSAMQSRDIDQLQLALEQFEDSGYDEDDVPAFVKAEQLFDALKIDSIREKLSQGIREKDIKCLEDAIDETELGGYIHDVNVEYKQAKNLLFHLKELERLRIAILEMNRSLISELHKYPKPPLNVHQVMMAVFVLMGEPVKKVKKWTEVQALLGKLGQDAITRRVRHFSAENINQRDAKRAADLLKDINLEEISEISKGAATFYAWTTTMIKESQYDMIQAESQDAEQYDVLGNSPHEEANPPTIATAWE